MADHVGAGFKAVTALVKSWSLGEYVYHVRHVKESGMNKHDFLVMFSVPHATKPVHEFVVNATFTVQIKESHDDGPAPPPKITYKFETQKQQLDGDALPVRKVWLDAAVRRKAKVLADQKMFAQEMKLPPPEAFVPGCYRAEAALLASANNGMVDNDERLLDAMAELGESKDVAARNAMESVAELEELLVNVFTEADKDGNGYLDNQEFSALLDTAELYLDESEKRQLLAMCDVNQDGRIEYSERAISRFHALFCPSLAVAGAPCTVLRPSDVISPDLTSPSACVRCR